MQIQAGKKIYFASDFHLGAPNFEESRMREDKICAWMDHIQPSCQELFLVGDLFDFWFEYKHSIPKGYIRFLAKIAQFTDAGIPVHVFTGNHDMWMFDYLPKELGVHIFREPITRVFNDKKFFIGHGDGLGPGDHGYKFLKKIFSSKICQWLFARLHPNFGIWLADSSSRSSRAKSGHEDAIYLGDDNEFLVQYCREENVVNPHDYFVFGHRHLPLNIHIEPNSLYLNLGDWLQYDTYAEFDGNELILNQWNERSIKAYF